MWVTILKAKYFHTYGLSERAFPYTFTYINTVVDPSMTRVWIKRVHLYMEFFNKYTVSPLGQKVLYLQVPHPRVQPTTDVESTEGRLLDLSIRRFW